MNEKKSKLVVNIHFNEYSDEELQRVASDTHQKLAQAIKEEWIFKLISCK